jgi:hypothetical protein
MSCNHPDEFFPHKIEMATLFSWQTESTLCHYLDTELSVLPIPHVLISWLLLLLLYPVFALSEWTKINFAIDLS